MSLQDFITKCASWGLLPNTTIAKQHYLAMKAMGPMGAMAGYSAQLRKLCMRVPNLDEYGSLQALKQADPGLRLNVVLVCHEIFHNLHHFVDPDSFKLRSKAKVPHWDNEEEMLTISGETGRVALPSTVATACAPSLFNEHSICRILRLSNRVDHHSVPVAVDTTGTVDLEATGRGPLLSEVWNLEGVD